MSSKATSIHGAMYHPVIVRPEPPGQFTAQPLGAPELRMVAATREEAVEKVRQALWNWTGSLHWVPVEVPCPNSKSLLDLAGHAKDDPDFDSYLEEIQRFRQEVEKRECSSSSSTPTT